MPKSKGERARWAVAAFILLSVTAVVVLSYFPESGISSCRQDLANNSSVVEVCGPIGLPDIVVVALLLAVAAFLIWPELSELGIANLINLKKQVDANTAKLDETSSKTDRAEDNIRALNLANEVPPPDDVALAATGLAQAFIVRPEPERKLSAERASAETELLSLARSLDRIIAITSARSPSADLLMARQAALLPHGDATKQLRALEVWERQFQDELATWAKVRNQAVHFPERLSDEQVAEGVKLAQQLIRAAQWYAKSGNADTEGGRGTSMSYRDHDVVSLTVGGIELGPARLTLRRDEPMPGIYGLKSWALTGSIAGARPLPDDAEVAATLEDGRVLSGRGLLTNSRISSGPSETATTYEYLGTGPLVGADDSDW